MKNTLKSLPVCIVMVLLCSLVGAQSTNSSSTVVPMLVQFSGVVTDGNGKPLSGLVGVTFSLYQEQQGGSPLWLETQNVQPSATGHYSVMLGSSTSQGLPANLFASGEARWLGVQVQGQAEQPRILLLSVPYALKAADAQTLGGLPATAFVLAAPNPSPGGTSALPSTAAPGSGPNIGGSGTEDYIPLWTDNNGDLGNSILFQSGSGSSAKVGINEKNPLFTLDVNGSVLARGLIELATMNYANKNKAYNSQPLNFESSAFDSGTGAYTLNHFQWQAEPTGNDTNTPGATLNLLYGTDPNQPAETGLNIASNGQITFATGQTFPGTGTITGITTASGSGLSGGGTSGSLSLSLVNTCAANQVLQWTGSAWACSSAGSGTVTSVGSGLGLTGGPITGSGTLSINTSVVPQLAAANTFTGNQTVNGNLSATGVVTGSSYQIGGNLFAFGSYSNANAFLGFAGNTTTTGVRNLASGYQALYSDTTGFANTASGYQALYSNNMGLSNNATGIVALFSNTSGSYNTADGPDALFSNTTGSYNTAIGASALLANTSGSSSTAVGASALAFSNGTGPNDAFGYTALSDNTTGTNNAAFGYQALLGNSTGNYNTASGSQALYNNSTGSNNVAIGSQALYSGQGVSYNTAIGTQALYSNTMACCLTAIGYQAMLHSNTSVSISNDAFGYQTLYSNTTGGDNAAFGYQALYFNSTGNNNTAYGPEALYSNTTGGNNTATGDLALTFNTIANNNTADGTAALFLSTGHDNTATGSQALISNNTGSENTAVGSGALATNYTGNDLTCVGYNCDSGADGLSNATAIGAHAVVAQSNSLVLGGTGEHAVKVGIGTTTPSNILTVGRGLGHPVSDSWETYSSRRWKINIQTLPDALSKVEHLRGVSYDLKDSGKHEIGVIAEEVGQVVPEVVSYEKNGKDATGVDYSRLTALLIEAVKQQQREIKEERAANRAELAKAARHIQRLEAEVGEARETLRKVVKAQITAGKPTLVAVK